MCAKKGKSDVSDLVSSMHSEKWATMTNRERSRKMDVYRKRLRRKKVSTEKMLADKNINADERERLGRALSSINESIEQSFYNRKTKSYNEKVVASFEVGDTIKDTQNQIRKNLQFSRELNLAKKGEPNKKGLTREDVDIFYYSTKGIWKASDIRDRNYAIMKHLNVMSLEEAFNMVMQSEDVIRARKEVEDLYKEFYEDTKEDLKGKETDENGVACSMVLYESVGSSRLFV